MLNRSYMFSVQKSISRCYATMSLPSTVKMPRVVRTKRWTARSKILLFSLCHFIPFAGIVGYYGVKSAKIEDRYLRYITLYKAAELATVEGSDDATLNAFFEQLDHILSQPHFRFLLVCTSKCAAVEELCEEHSVNQRIIVELPAVTFTPSNAVLIQAEAAPPTSSLKQKVSTLGTFAREVCSDLINQVNQEKKPSLKSVSLQLSVPHLSSPRSSVPPYGNLMFLGRDIIVEAWGPLEVVQSESCNCVMTPTKIQVHFPCSVTSNHCASTAVANRNETSWNLMLRPT